MSKTTDKWLELINAGTNVVVDGAGKTTDKLVELAVAAKARGVHLTILDADEKMNDGLLKAVAAGRPNGTISGAPSGTRLAP